MKDILGHLICINSCFWLLDLIKKRPRISVRCRVGAPFNQWLSMSQSCRAYSSARQSARQSVVELRYSAVWLTCFSHPIYATRACTRAVVCPLNPPSSFIAYTQHFSLQSATLVSQRRCIGASQLATTDHEPSSSPPSHSQLPSYSGYGS